MNIHVCFAISSFGIGGAQKQCIALMNALSARPDVQVSLIYYHEGENFPALEKERIKCHRINSNSQYKLRNVWRMVRILREDPPDILFSWLQASDVFSAIAHHFLPKTTWIMAERDSHYPNDWRFNLRSRLGKKAHHIIANSDSGKNYWVNKGVGSHKVSVFPNINLVPISDHERTFENKRKVIYAGRLEEQKQSIRVAEVFSYAARKIRADFEIIGNGSQSEKVKEITRKSLRENLSVLPYDTNILAKYNQNPVYVTLSLHEGTPNAVIENIAFGNNIVASKIPEHIALLGEKYPFYVNVNADDETITAMINKALTVKDPQLLDQARQQIGRLTAQSVSSEYVALFRKLCGRAH